MRGGGFGIRSRRRLLRGFGRGFWGFGGVGAGVDGFQLLDARLRVNGGGFELFVAEELLDEADVGPAFEHVRGATVADEVAASRATDFGLLDELAHHAADDVGVEALAVTGEEEGFFRLVNEELGADFVEVAFEPFQGAGADGNNAVFVAFALADLQGLPLAVEVGDFEAGQFAAADAGAVKGFEHGAVAEAERIGDVGNAEDAAHFTVAEGFGGKAFFLPWQLDLAGGVGLQDVLAGEPGEVILERAEAAALGADAKRLAVGFAPPPEVALVAFEDGLGDGGGGCEVALGRPLEEELEGVAAAFDGAGGVVPDGEPFEVARGFSGEAAGDAGWEVGGGVAATFFLGAVAEVLAAIVAFFAVHAGKRFNAEARRSLRVAECFLLGLGGCNPPPRLRVRLRRMIFAVQMCDSAKPRSWG